MGTVTDNVSGNLQRLRKERGISRRKLRELMSERGADIHVTTLKRIEEGDQPVKVDELVALSEIYGVPVEEIINSSGIDQEKVWYNVYADARCVIRDLTKISEKLKTLPKEEVSNLWIKTIRDAENSISKMLE